MMDRFELQKLRDLPIEGVAERLGLSVVRTTKEDCGAQTITVRRVIFTPETERIVVGQEVNKKGKVVQKYVVAKKLVRDVVFEETYDTSMQPEEENAGGGEGGGGNG